MGSKAIPVEIVWVMYEGIYIRTIGNGPSDSEVRSILNDMGLNNPVVRGKLSIDDEYRPAKKAKKKRAKGKE